MLPYENFKYQHVERWDTDEVQYLKSCKTVTVQPKIDGTNAVIICELDRNGQCIDIQAGSRNRYLTPDDDNEGFAKWVILNKEKFETAAAKIVRSFVNNDGRDFDQSVSFVPYVVFYGEFTKKGKFHVKPECMHNFYVFDVKIYTNEAGTLRQEWFCPEKFADVFLKTAIDRVPSIIDFDTSLLNEKGEEWLLDYLKWFSLFIMEDGFETGEGFVLKDYGDAANQYGRKTWAKILYDKPRSPQADLYQDITENWFVISFLEKEYIKLQDKEPAGKQINPQKFANLVVREFFKEEIANIVLKKKLPVIDFRKLQSMLSKKALYWLSKREPSETK